MPSRMEFQLNLPKSATNPVRRDPTAPLRFLIMADFSGRADRETPGPLADLASRPLLTVDVDSLDAVMARLTPKLRLAGAESGSALTLSFSQLDDFHPDALYRRVEGFQALRRSRTRLLNPASFAQAAAELAPLPSPSPVQAGPVPTGNDADLLGRLLGQPSTPSPAVRPVDPGAAAVQSFLRVVVQPHIVHTDPNQSAWVAAVDAAISDQLRAILHQPAFQALEAAYRSVQGLVAAFDSDTVQVALFDVTRQELLADLRSAGGDPTATSLYTRLIDQGVQMPDGQPWSLLIGDYRFGNGPEDIALLAALGALAAHAGGPFLAEAAPGLLGTVSAAALADPGNWAPLSAAQAEHWQALRQCAIAPWLGLALPRVLLRLPYGRKTDPVEQIEFEEMPMGRDPDAYLWGNPAFVCARLIAAAFVENGEGFSPGDVLELEDLSAHVYEEAGERVMQSATEVLLSEQVVQAVLARGLMPLLGHRQRHAIRLARFQSLAEPAMALAGVTASV
ncbi:MAG TPA: type VI secretion system contractile sheath large subunit [Candidatus Competibacteraceae bacterium]|nr:type VI secretion system contractile sheath large subunit [Candidatus Competibacteraceae bacterium]HRZ06023.1 type VI secretion system contractile sheath large subunit [Candidatus Competibacteraceae bacterium]HSA46390.1 type VI secretion system contractile sheath large subunit [Candidatus Competibacteraceae bacterium]